MSSLDLVVSESGTVCLFAHTCEILYSFGAMYLSVFFVKLGMLFPCCINFTTFVCLITFVMCFYCMGHLTLKI